MQFGLVTFINATRRRAGVRSAGAFVIGMEENMFPSQMSLDEERTRLSDGRSVNAIWPTLTAAF